MVINESSLDWFSVSLWHILINIRSATGARLKVDKPNSRLGRSLQISVRNSTSTECPCTAAASQPPADNHLETSQWLPMTTIMFRSWCWTGYSLWILVLPSVPQVQAILLVLAFQGHPGDLVYPWTENNYNNSCNIIPTHGSPLQTGGMEE